MRMNLNGLLSARTSARTSALTSALTLVLAVPAQAAGQVEVKYIDAAAFTDIGFGSFERERNQRSLDETFKRLARQLPDGQTLRVDVLDVDLAGEVRPGSVHNIRVVRGGADWPRIKLRYTLTEGSNTRQGGEQLLADMNYLFNQRSLGPRDGALPYENRLLERWFSDTFSTPKRAPALSPAPSP